MRTIYLSKKLFFEKFIYKNTLKEIKYEPEIKLTLLDNFSLDEYSYENDQYYFKGKPFLDLDKHRFFNQYVSTSSSLEWLSFAFRDIDFIDKINNITYRIYKQYEVPYNVEKLVKLTTQPINISPIVVIEIPKLSKKEIINLLEAIWEEPYRERDRNSYVKLNKSFKEFELQIDSSLWHKELSCSGVVDSNWNPEEFSLEYSPKRFITDTLGLRNYEIVSALFKFLRKINTRDSYFLVFSNSFGSYFRDRYDIFDRS